MLNSELIKNDLIVNLRKGKTEALLFGTRRFNMLHGKLTLKFGLFETNSTNKYKYLGSVIDKRLALSEKFNHSYKKAFSRQTLFT